MKKCPKCGKEYYNNFTICTECNIFLDGRTQKVSTSMVRKTIGIIFMIPGVLLGAYSFKLFIEDEKAWKAIKSNPHAIAEPGLAFGIGLGILVILALPIFTAGLCIFCSHDKDKHPDMAGNFSRFICPKCKSIYDKTWKICLKCGIHLDGIVD